MFARGPCTQRAGSCPDAMVKFDIKGNLARLPSGGGLMSVVAPQPHVAVGLESTSSRNVDVSTRGRGSFVAL